MRARAGTRILEMTVPDSSDQEGGRSPRAGGGSGRSVVGRYLSAVLAVRPVLLPSDEHFQRIAVESQFAIVEPTDLGV